MKRRSAVGISHCAVAIFLLSMTGCGRVNTEQASKSPTPEVRTSAQVVRLNTTVLTLTRGSDSAATMTVTIAPGFHINANPATFPYLIATEVTPAKVDGISIGTPIYPVAQNRKFQFSEAPLAVYEGSVAIKIPLKAERNSAKGARSLPVDLRVQACDEEKCFPPDNLQTTIALDVK